MILPNIDYFYWKDKNEYFQDIPLIDSIKRGISYAKRAHLIGDILEINQIRTNKDLVNLIALKINAYALISEFSDKELLEIFDLIQAWGGQTGRGPYVIPKHAPVRMTLPNYVVLYRAAIDNLGDDYDAALRDFTKLPRLGESFATKHMFFWSTYRINMNSMPIFDTRIKNILNAVNEDVSYRDYVIAIKNKSNTLGIPCEEIERALFSFSQNYFPNSSLMIKSSLVDQRDLHVAQKLSNHKS